MKRYVLGITGASGAVYGVRLAEALLADPQREVHLVISPAGARVMGDELGIRPAATRPESWLNVTPEQAARLHLHPHGDIGAGPASGTFKFEAMIIAPCSIKTLGALAAGIADNLITRAGDVAIKEGRPLMLMVRETPLSLIHLRAMTTLAEAGAIIMPPAPAFYHRPQSIEDLVRFMTQKAFDRLGLEFPEPFRWGESGKGKLDERQQQE